MILSFSGHTWHIKSATDSKVGPGPNYFCGEEDGVFVDEKGLHLKTTLQYGKYFSSEVVLEEKLGYGNYAFQIDSLINDLDANTIFGAFLYHDDNHEIDIEFGPALAGESKGQYVIQPWEKEGHISRFIMPPIKQSSHSILWSPGRVEFVSWVGHEKNPTPETMLGKWKYEGKSMEISQDPSMIFNLWLHKGKNPDRLEEVIIKSFSFESLSKD
jgi:hypothetical protein